MPAANKKGSVTSTKRVKGPIASTPATKMPPIGGHQCFAVVSCSSKKKVRPFPPIGRVRVLGFIRCVWLLSVCYGFNVELYSPLKEVDGYLEK